MARRGPKPEPAAVKEAKGNPGRRKVGADPVAVESAGSVSPPVWLKDDALVVWKRLAPRLIALKLLSATDVETFGRYCRNFARWLKMQKRLDEESEIYEIETASGIVRRADPAFAVSDRLERQLVVAEALFGLNPAERQRIFAARASTPPPGDLFAGQQPSAPASVANQSNAKPGSPVGFLQ